MADEQSTHVGVSESFKRSAGYVQEEYLPQLSSYTGKRTMRTMLDDATYGGILFVINNIFRSIEWKVELPSEMVGDADAEMKRTYLEHALFHDIGTDDDLDSRITFDDYVQNALTMLPWGYSLIHPVFKKRPDGYAGIGRFIQIAPETVDRWKIKEPLGSMQGVYQQSPSTYVTNFVERNDLIHFKTQPYKGSPEGYSIFRPSYKSWYRREALQTTESILAERGTGFPVIIADPKFKEESMGTGPRADVMKSVVKTIESIPAKVRVNEQSGLTLWTDNYKNPDGTDTGNPRIKFSFAPVGTTNTVQFREAIRDYDMAIARSVMAQFMFNGSDGGNRALDKSQTSTFLKAINGFAEIIASGTNRQLVQRLWELNGWQEDDYMPYVVPVNVDKADLAEIGQFIQAMSSSGATIFPNEGITEYMLGLAGVPADIIDKDGEEL